MVDRTDPDFTCWKCDRPLMQRDGAVCCSNCSETIPVVNDIPRFPVALTQESSRDVFDRLAPMYETPLWFQPLYRFIGDPFAPREDRSTITALLDVNANTVLDVACGTGRFTRYIAADVAVVSGIDISDGMLEQAQQYADRDGINNVTFARMSAERLWFDADTFDRVACCWALHLFGDVLAALREMHRVLHPGGWLAGTTLVNRYVLAVPGVHTITRRILGVDAFAVEDLRELFHEAGFSAVDFDRRGTVLFFRARNE